MIKVVICGMGATGKGLFRQCLRTPGIDVVGIADIQLEHVYEICAQLDKRFDLCFTEVQANDASSMNRLAITSNGDILARMEADVFIEASNTLDKSAEFCVRAINRRKHVILANSEIDLMYGTYFAQLAQSKGVISTSCDGDRHTVLARMIDDINLWGLKIVMAGNIKGFLDIESNPNKIKPEADTRNLSYEQATAYADGTKLAIEMALVANAYGYDIPPGGMKGPSAKNVHDALLLFDFNWERPVVDYILGANPGGGVFVVAFCDDEYQKSMLRQYKMGDGPYYLLYRPYHLHHIESMRCIFEAAEGKALLQSRHNKTNVYAWTKKHLHEGQILDGIGGHHCRGVLQESKDNPGLPICLSRGLRLKHYVPVNSKIRLDDVEIDEKQFRFWMWKRAKNAA